MEYRQKVRAIKNRVMRQLLQKTKSILQSFDSKDFKDYWHITYVPEHICNDKKILSTWDCVPFDKRIMKCVFNINVDQMLHRVSFSKSIRYIASLAAV